MIGHFGLAGSARLPRGFLTRWRGDSGRGQRLTSFATTAVTLNDTLSRDVARILQQNSSSRSAHAPTLRPNRAKSRDSVSSMVTEAMLLVSNLCFLSGDSYQRREKTRVCRCGLPRRSSRVLVASYWWILTVILREIFGASHWCAIWFQSVYSGATPG